MSTQPSPQDLNYPSPPFPQQCEGPAHTPAGKLGGKRALITGGASGIGRAVAVLYAKEGADVALVYLPEEQSDAEQTRSAVEEEGRRCVLIPGDVASSRFCTSAVQQAVEDLGGIDILVNNAAFQQTQDHLEDLTDEQLDKTFKTNIYAFFYLSREAIKHMKPGSAIVNCGSVAGLRGSAKLLDYAATKGAIDSFTKSLAVNLAERRIRVNCVAPGVQTPEAIAPAFVSFSGAADSNFVTGEILALQGAEIVS